MGWDFSGEAGVKAAKVSKAAIRKVLRRFEKGKASLLIPLLQALQEELGWLSREALEEAARHLRVPLSRVYGVATFYAQFYLEPRGRHTIRVCRGTACFVKGADQIIKAVVKASGAAPGRTSDDGLFSLEIVACLGTCFLAPVMMVDGNYYGRLDAQKAAEIIRMYKEKESKN